MKTAYTALSLALLAAFSANAAQNEVTPPLNENTKQQQAKDDKSIEVIEVIGDFRKESIQDKAQAISVLDEAIFERRSANHLEDIFSSAPNVNFASGSSRARFFQIRGIGIRSEYSNPVQPSVGLLIDGIDFSSIGTGATLYDMEQVEIYRGPQGTRFGANALAGMIYLESQEPSEELEGKITLGLGNYGHKELGGVISSGITDDVSARFAIHNYKSDGFIENDFLGVDDTNNRDETTIRSKIDWQINDTAKLDVNLFHINIDSGFDAFSLDNTRHTLSDQPGSDKQISNALGLKYTQVFANSTTMQAMSSFSNSNTEYSYDEDWSFVGIAPGWEYSSFDSYKHKKDDVNLEFRFLSGEKNKLFNDTTQWVAGIYFNEFNDDLIRQYTYLESDYSSSIKTQKAAIYAQFDTQLTSQWSTEFGLRHESYLADYSNSDGFVEPQTQDMTGGKFLVKYQANENQNLYASINRGYKVGGFNVDSSLSDAARSYKPEYLINYELGFKHKLVDQQAWYRLAVFYMDRKDVQVNDYTLVTREDNSTAFIQSILNSDLGYSQGIELDSGWQLNEQIDLYANLGWLETQFDEFTNNKGDDVPERDLSHAPHYSYNLGLNYFFSDDLFLNLEVEGKDQYFFSANHNEQSDSYNLVHASINYTLEDWQIKLWARNLGDSNYYTRGFGFANDPRDEYETSGYYQFGDPALFGLKAEYQF